MSSKQSPDPGGPPSTHIQAAEHGKRKIRHRENGVHCICVHTSLTGADHPQPSSLAQRVCFPSLFPLKDHPIPSHLPPKHTPPLPALAVSFFIEKMAATKQELPSTSPPPPGPTLPTCPLLLWLNCPYSKRKTNLPPVLCTLGPLTFSRSLLLNLHFPVSAVLLLLSSGPLNHTCLFSYCLSLKKKKGLTSLTPHAPVATPLQQDDSFAVHFTVSP